ncbi:MAG: hypothetical protein ACERKD_16995 [Prolixibacteraceae bacterium]
MMEFKQIASAGELPLEWNERTENYFQQSPFLSHTEKYNPCQQRYYGCFKNNKLLSGAIVYSLHMDLLTFLRIKSPIKMHIVGIPCSVSSSGIFGDGQAVEALKKYLLKHEKGFVLLLNLTERPDNTSCASGKTLPTIILKNTFSNWNEYTSALRSNYRRRLHQINSKNKNLRFEKMGCSNFTDEMYRLYLGVYQRSKDKLEKLTFDFFKQLPDEFQLTICFKNDSIIGWNITLHDADNYYFFLGGINYQQNKTNQTYFGLLCNLIKDGIEKKAKTIDLGQTAEIAKMRMGGQPRLLYMEAHHHLRLVNGVIKQFSSLLEYKRKLENTKAMKENRT